MFGFSFLIKIVPKSNRELNILICKIIILNIYSLGLNIHIKKMGREEKKPHKKSQPAFFGKNAFSSSRVNVTARTDTLNVISATFTSKVL